MLDQIKRYFAPFIATLVAAVSFIGYAHAQCTAFLPGFLGDMVCGDNAVDALTNRIRTALLLAFGVVIIVAIAYVILAAIRFIRSKGEASEMEGSTKAIAAIFYGVGALFVGIIGIVIVNLFFGSVPIFPNRICIEDPASAGCYACGVNSDDARLACDFCNNNIENDECIEKVPSSLSPADSAEVIEDILGSQ